MLKTWELETSRDVKGTTLSGTLALTFVANGYVALRVSRGELPSSLLDSFTKEIEQAARIATSLGVLRAGIASFEAQLTLQGHRSVADLYIGQERRELLEAEIRRPPMLAVGPLILTTLSYLKAAAQMAVWACC